MIKLGRRIRELREQEDLSLRELARKLGVSAAFLSDVELGHRSPSNKILAKIAQAIGTSLEALLEYDTRLPLDELRRLAVEDPAYGLAFRRMIDNKITSDALLKLVNGKRQRKSKR